MIKDQNGQVTVLALIVLGILLLLALALSGYLTNHFSSVTKTLGKEKALQIAEAGLEKAIWVLNQPGGSSYTGESNTTFSDGKFSVSVTAVNGYTKIIESEGFVSSGPLTLSSTKIKVQAVTDTNLVSFNYGVQVGDQGVQMNTSNTIKGSIYSNGSIIGGDINRITGDAWVAGGTAPTPSELSDTCNTDFEVGRVGARSDMAQGFTPQTSVTLNKVSLYTKKVGSPSDKTVRILADSGGTPSKTSLASGTLRAAQVTADYSWVYVSLNAPTLLQVGTTYWILIDSSANSSSYFVWCGDQTDSYAGGTGKYSSNWVAPIPSWTPLFADFNFKIWVGEISTYIQRVQIDGNLYAHSARDVDIGGNVEAYELISNSTVGGNAYVDTLTDCQINGNAYYNSIFNCPVGGTKYPNETGIPRSEPAPSDMPISDGQIADWKAEAEAGGVISGDYTLSLSEHETLGPTKITGNLNLNNNNELVMTGNIWVQGDVLINNGNLIRLSPTAYGASSGVLVADGKITLNNSNSFQGTGQSGSYLMLLSTRSAPNIAIEINNTPEGGILYASAGLAQVNNANRFKELVAYGIVLNNSTEITYESGLRSVNFSTGPAAAWTIRKESWQVQ